MKNQYNTKYTLKDLDGMTVNERLCHCGLFDEFDNAIKNDENKVRQILKELFVDEASIELLINQKR